MVKKRFQVIGMHCVGCAMSIDGVLEDLPGVKSAATNYARQFVEVNYDENQVTEKLIISAIQTEGYTASLAENK